MRYQRSHVRIVPSAPSSNPHKIGLPSTFENRENRLRVFRVALWVPLSTGCFVSGSSRTGRVFCHSLPFLSSLKKGRPFNQRLQHQRSSHRISSCHFSEEEFSWRFVPQHFSRPLVQSVLHFDDLFVRNLFASLVFGKVFSNGSVGEFVGLPAHRRTVHADVFLAQSLFFQNFDLISFFQGLLRIAHKCPYLAG